MQSLYQLSAKPINVVRPHSIILLRCQQQLRWSSFSSRFQQTHSSSQHDENPNNSSLDANSKQNLHTEEQKIAETTWTWLKRGKQEETDHLINPHSLQETLNAHIEANRTKIRIHKVKTDDPEAFTRIKNGEHKPHRRVAFRHLVLDRDEPKEPHQGWKEYEGESQPLAMEWQIKESLPRYLQYPWIQDLDNSGPSHAPSIRRLEDELRSIDAYFTPTSTEKKAADLAIHDIECALLEESDVITRVDVIGSRTTGLAHPVSDIDINIRTKNENSDERREHTLELLWKLFRKFKFSFHLKKLFQTNYVTRRARVPILACTHVPTGIELQIQSHPTSNGSLEYMKVLHAEYPTLRPLFKVIKQMLSMRGLTTGNRGGITSYPLLNMIIASVKMHEGKTDPYDAGQQLLQFLDFFIDINFYTTGIAQRPSKYMQDMLNTSISQDTDWLELSDAVMQDPTGATPVLFDVRKDLGDLHMSKSDYMMTLHDPNDPYNDLGKSAYNIKHIQATFLDVRTQLTKAMEAWDEKFRVDGVSDPKPEPLLRSLIEADYSLYIRDRKNLVSNYEERLKQLNGEGTGEISDDNPLKITRVNYG